MNFEFKYESAMTGNYLLLINPLKISESSEFLFVSFYNVNE
jgi:hypothetical protein